MTDATATNTAETTRPAPRMILQVGPGLAKCQSDLDAGTCPREHRSETTSMLSKLFQEGLTKTNLNLHIGDSSFLLIAPESLCTEAHAARVVLQRFAKTRSIPGAMLGVVSFSHGLITTLVNALFTANVHQEVVVIVHYADEREPTAHGMDEEGFLEDWPYGILDASVDEDSLLEMGFDVPHRR